MLTWTPIPASVSAAEKRETLRNRARGGSTVNRGHEHQRSIRCCSARAGRPRDPHGQRYPYEAAVFLDAPLIGLPLPQVPGVFDPVLLHGWALVAGARPPSGACALVKPKRRGGGEEK
jgi:hypothetical protein